MMRKAFVLTLLSALVFTAYSVDVYEDDEFDDVRSVPSFEYDEDEFEGIPSGEAPQAVEPPQKKKNESKQKPSPTPVSADLSSEVKDYTYETIAVALIVVYILNYFVGRSSNESITTAWENEFRPLFEKNFAELGNPGESWRMKENCNFSQYYSSGRVFCECAMATLDLVKRQDLISILYGLVFPGADELTLEISMNKEDMDKFVFAVYKKAEAKTARTEYKDLELYAENIATKLPKSFVVMTDAPELAAEILTDDVVSALTKYEKYFMSMHISDEAVFTTHKQMIKFVFQIPPAKDMSNLSVLMRMAVFFVDSVGRIRLSQQARSRNEKKRAAALEVSLKAAQAQRQEELQRKKQEKKKAREEAIMNLSEEAQRKFDEKEYKKSLKKKGPKFKLM